MRRIFTTAEALAAGDTADGLRWKVRCREYTDLGRGVYGEGGEPPTLLDRSIAGAVVNGGAVAGQPAGVMLGFDSMELTVEAFTVPSTVSNKRTGARRRDLPPNRIVEVAGYRVTSGLQTLIDIASEVDELVWEQALESGLFRGHVTIAEIEAALPELSRARTPGLARIRRVLALRPASAPPTESLLETLMVQLARAVGAPEPTRQFRVFEAWGEFVARVDLCWPELGVFIELDGQHHAGQPVYDANRETRVVAATGWLCARFTWDEVRRHPKATGRRLLRVLEQARRRPTSLFAAPEAV